MKLKILTGVAALVAVVAALAIGAMATASADTPNCIPTSPDDPTCLWQLELTKVEVAVEYEYPHCEVKLTVDDNIDELPDGAFIRNEYYYAQIWYAPAGEHKSNYYFTGGHTNFATNWVSLRQYTSGYPDWRPQWDGRGWREKHSYFNHNESSKVEKLADLFDDWQQVTLGSFHMQAQVSYDNSGEFVSEFARERRVGNRFVNYLNKLPSKVVSDPIPLSHTFAGLTEEIFACFEVAKREHGRVEERSALDTEKAGLRQSLKLLEAELARAREHELDATNVLKEVIAISARVEEARRAIQRLRVEGIAERRKLIERYYAEESQRYSVFVKSLEASASALAASDKAIAAHKAELEASRARLDALVTAAQEAEAELIAEIERAQEALGEDDD